MALVLHMNMSFDVSRIAGYKSKSQIARILTETWISENMFCPRCGNFHIRHFENNRPVADFFCEKCASEFELKSKNGILGNSIADGAYDAMISRITGKNTPDFMFMGYSLESYSVSNLLFVPKHFFTPAVIEKRNPLSANARRAGWTGCNILLNEIPQQCRISIITNGVAKDIDSTVQAVHTMSALEIEDIDSRGWLLDILNCMNKIQTTEFSLADVYRFEKHLEKLHPNNNNIRAKIRQQLQLLRNKHFIEFLGKGMYRKVQ